MTANRFSSVVEMLEKSSVDDSLKQEAIDRIKNRRLIKTLMALRVAQDVSQEQLAARMNCSQSRISKLENGNDDDLRLGDLRKYAEALKLDLRVGFMKQETTLVEQVKLHAFAIKRLLDKLANLAHGDHQIAKAISGFFNEAFFNLVRIMQDSSSKLPNRPDSEKPNLQIEVMDLCEGEEDCEDSTDFSDNETVQSREVITA